MKKNKIRKQANMYTDILQERFEHWRKYLKNASGRSKYVVHFREQLFCFEDELNKLIRTLEEDDE